MSIENARMLARKIQTDETLRTTINQSLEQAFAVVAQKENLSCTLADFSAAIKDIQVSRTIDVKKIGDVAVIGSVTIVE